MRIISGKLKGRVITPPKNLRARPTTDFAKENLFNVLSHRIDLSEYEVLDLFAGTGSMSFEFASRGAESVVSVEIHPIHQQFIARTAKEFGLDTLYAVKANAFLYVKSTPKRFDLIFADPPYDLPRLEELPDLIFTHQLLKPDGLLILEHSKSKDFSDHPNFSERRSYGSVNFSFFVPQAASSEE